MEQTTRETLANVAASQSINTSDTLFTDLDQSMSVLSEYIYIVGSTIFIKFNSIKLFVVEYKENSKNLYLLAFVILQLRNLIKEHLTSYIQANFNLNSVSITMHIEGTAFLYGNAQTTNQTDVYFRKRKRVVIDFRNTFFSSSLSDFIALLRSEMDQLISSENRPQNPESAITQPDDDQRQYINYNETYFLSDSIRFEIVSQFLTELFRRYAATYSTFRKTFLLNASKLSFSANNLWFSNALNTKDTTTNFTSAPQNTAVTILDALRDAEFSEIMGDLILSNSQSNTSYRPREIQNLLYKKKLLDYHPFGRLIYKKQQHPPFSFFSIDENKQFLFKSTFSNRRDISKVFFSGN
jgi:hypothetical protein